MPGPMPPPIVWPPPGALPPPPVPPGPVPVLPIDSTHRTANDACIQRLRQLQVNPNPRVYPVPGEPGQLGTEVVVQTNIFGLEVKKRTEIYQYVVHIKADLSNTKEVVFTKKGREDFVVLDRHEKCCNIFFHAAELFSEFFRVPENKLIYDGQSILFTTLDLFPGATNLTQKTKLMEINGALLKNPELHTLPAIKLEVYVGKNPPLVFSSETIGRRTADPNIEANNRGFHQFLDLVLNQMCVRETDRFACFEHGKTFFVQPENEGFEERDCVNVGDGKYMLPGIKKNVQFIEGPAGRGQNNPAVIIDAMKAAFHREQLVFDKIGYILNKEPRNQLSEIERERCRSIIKGLDCHSTYTGRTRHLKIEGIHHGGAGNSQFQLKDGRSMTVADYMKEKYKIDLRYPNLNLLICKERGNTNYYPMELMKITKNQRVTIPQLTSAQSQLTIKESAVVPAVRQRLIMTGKNAANICSGNDLLDTLGLYVCPEPLVVKGRLLSAGSAEYSDKHVSIASGKWRAPPSRYLRPAEAPKVWAIYAIGSTTSRFTQQDLEKFTNEFINMCRSKGIMLDQPADCKLILIDNAEKTLLMAAEARCQFSFVITDDCVTHLHQKYKVIERDHRMIVQDMMMSKALSVIHKARKLTLENVINKTNVKLGGTNYIISDRKRFLADQLVIGVGVSAPPPGTKFYMDGKRDLHPSIIGFACNAKADQEFTGDFVLSEVGQDTLCPIEDIVKNCVNLYKHHRNTFPKKIVIYRSGVSEGAHGPVIAYEIPLARNSVRELSEDIKLVYIVVTKDHAYRFFKNQPDPNTGSIATDYESASISGSTTGSVRTSRSSSTVTQSMPTDLNLPSGVLVDSYATHPACKQFFLNSHTTLQGTAKTPLYTVLADDCNASLATIEEMTYALCHNHQIVNLATSLPTPLYVAIEYAKRGRNLFIERAAKGGLECQGSEREQLQDLTREISYRNSGYLVDRRVNA